MPRNPWGTPGRRELLGIAAIACSHTLRWPAGGRIAACLGIPGTPQAARIAGRYRDSPQPYPEGPAEGGGRLLHGSYCAAARGADRRRLAPRLPTAPKVCGVALVDRRRARAARSPVRAEAPAHAARPRMQTTGTDGRRRRATRFAAEFAWHFRSPEDSRHGMRCAAHDCRLIQPFGSYAPHHIAVDPTRIGKGFARNHGREAPIEIRAAPRLTASSAMRALRVMEMPVLRGVHGHDVIGPGLIPWRVIVARTEREPADVGSTIGSASTRNSAGRIDKGDERRGIDRMGIDSARDPSPMAVDVDPPAIVKRRETPGLIVDPSPAPRFDPIPMAKAIRRPVVRHGSREPHRSCIGNGAPSAITVEVIGSGRSRPRRVGLFGEAFAAVDLRRIAQPRAENRRQAFVLPRR